VQAHHGLRSTPSFLELGAEDNYEVEVSVEKLDDILTSSKNKSATWFNENGVDILKIDTQGWVFLHIVPSIVTGLIEGFTCCGSYASVPYFTKIRALWSRVGRYLQPPNLPFTVALFSLYGVNIGLKNFIAIRLRHLPKLLF
jgi:hypothetical protein